MVPLLAQLATGRLDAVWGSRRLSVRDIEESYRFRYRRKAVAGAISYLGSYLLSLACPGPVRPLHHRHAVRRACAPGG